MQDIVQLRQDSNDINNDNGPALDNIPAAQVPTEESVICLELNRLSSPDVGTLQLAYNS